MPGEAEKGESEKMGGGKSGLFQGSVRERQGVAQEAPRLSTSLEKKGPLSGVNYFFPSATIKIPGSPLSQCQIFI